MELGWETLLFGGVVTALAACLQGTIGFGFAVASVPILALVDSRLAPVPQLVLSAPLVLSMAWRERHAIQLRAVGWILLGRIPGALIGVLLLKLFAHQVLDLLLAAIVILAVILLSGARSIPQNGKTQFSAGVVSGVMGLIASMGGPPLALLFRDAKGDALRSNLAAVFVVGLTITIVARVGTNEMSWGDVETALYMMPGLFVGLAMSRFFAGKVEGALLRRAVLFVATVSALGLAIRAIMG
jgi:hypothetical protein